MSVWRPVLAFPDYDVAVDGRVRRSTGGRGVQAGRVLRPQRQPNGYAAVQLYRAGIPTRRTVHSIVAEAFLGPRPPGHEVDHVDGDRTNNAAANLRYCTPLQNRHFARDRGSFSGESNPAARLSDDDVDAIRSAARAGEPQRSIAARFGVSQGHVSALVRHRRRAPGRRPS